MQDEESGIGLGTIGAVGAGIAGLVFRRNIGKFVRDYSKEFARTTDPDALLKKQRKTETDENIKKFFSDTQEQEAVGIEQVAPKQDIVPVDKVDEIINPPPMSPGEVARKESQNILKKENQILADIKRETRKQPLTLGGSAFNNDMYGIG